MLKDYTSTFEIWVKCFCAIYHHCIIQPLHYLELYLVCMHCTVFKFRKPLGHLMATVPSYAYFQVHLHLLCKHLQFG